MKIRYSLVALFVVMGMLLAACGAPAARPHCGPGCPDHRSRGLPTDKPVEPPRCRLAPRVRSPCGTPTAPAAPKRRRCLKPLDAFKKENPDVKVDVLQIPFDQVFNKWETEVAAGGGPDMYTVPNDNTGNQVRAKLLAPVDDLIKGQTDGFRAVLFDGATIDGKLYGVPGIIKAVALYYNKSTVPNPPKTTDELLALVKSGKKIAINQNNYHNFGWLTGAFGGKLMDAAGVCTADQGGFADALQYMKDLKAAGASFETDGAKSRHLLRHCRLHQLSADAVRSPPAHWRHNGLS